MLLQKSSLAPKKKPARKVRKVKKNNAKTSSADLHSKELSQQSCPKSISFEVILILTGLLNCLVQQSIMFIIFADDDVHEQPDHRIKVLEEENARLRQENSRLRKLIRTKISN